MHVYMLRAAVNPYLEAVLEARDPIRTEPVSEYGVLFFPQFISKTRDLMQ